MKIKFIRWIALFPMIFLFSCGTLNKQQSKSNSSVSNELISTENMSESNLREFSEWQKAWMHDWQYNTFLLHSDSTIILHSDSSISLANGTLFFTQAKQHRAAIDQGSDNKQEQSSQLQQQVSERLQTKESTLYKEKERQLIKPIIWIAILVLLVFINWRK